MRGRVRYGQRELKRISRTATPGGLFLSFLKIGLVGFGGGLAVIAQIRTLTVRKRHWLNEFEFAEGFALAQSLPGTAAGNVATYVGLKLRGWRGASVAMGGFMLPSMLLMIVLRSRAKLMEIRCWQIYRMWLKINLWTIVSLIS